MKWDSGKGAEFLDGDELVGFFFIILFDFGQEFLPIALTFAGDELDIFRVYDASLSEHWLIWLLVIGYFD